MNKISETIKELRKKNDMSQDQLAETMMVSRQAISNWERGEAAPDIENLSMLSKVFGVSVDELIHGVKPQFVDKTAELKEKHFGLRVRAILVLLVSVLTFVLSPIILISFSHVFGNKTIIVFFGAIALGIVLIFVSGLMFNRYKSLIGIESDVNQMIF